ncbi:helix-turn-helix protein [Keratinibaculum paraultunense]|uniref:Helix-turn-helix protein n=1 Tax=Keratinibaculum paraultunense TaxID=1278232 RepID=A0A4R3KZ47_9FIRM|nr:helix-turn-helix domain-containing protein [Keratinibaculum paraultunense]QQY79207.1 helix-turn-helix transcriptional regulator [Keratinibaculum paraultunense]TCS89336.1 helix-turn-helix protein [Keratinibaculum paraultunense]
MYYDLKSFGAEVRNIRNNLELTQSTVSELSDIHVDTIRKIENGKVLPTQETLDLLSPVLKKDLNALLLEHRLHDYHAFEEVKNRLESKLDKGEFETLSIELEDLKALLDNTLHPYFINSIYQLILMTEAIIFRHKHEDPLTALNKLVDAMKVTTPDFTLDNYSDFVYNSMELRILMNMALMINELQSTDKSLEIMKYCIESAKSAEPNDNIFPKICYNLSYTYHRLGRDKEALKYSNLGIDYCLKNRNYSGLNLLYFRRGIAEYFLKHDNYKDSLKKAVYFAEMLGHYELRDLFISNCKKYYNIDIL